MKQTTKRFASMVIGLVFLTAAFITYFEFIQPAYDDAQTAKAAFNAQQQFLSAEQETVKKVQDLISSYEGQGRIQDAVSSALPLQENVVEGVVQLSGIASQSGLTLSSVAVNVASLQNAGKKPAAGVSTAADFTASLQKPLGTVAFQIKINGQYENIKQFVSFLATNIRIFDIKTMNLQSQTVTQGVGQTKTTQQTYNLDMTLTAYYQSK